MAGIATERVGLLSIFDRSMHLRMDPGKHCWRSVSPIQFEGGYPKLGCGNAKKEDLSVVAPSLLFLRGPVGVVASSQVWLCLQHRPLNQAEDNPYRYTIQSAICDRESGYRVRTTKLNVCSWYVEGDVCIGHSRSRLQVVTPQAL